MTSFLNARWENLIMANYAVDPELLLPYLPKGVELDFYENKTYVSLVGFMFINTRVFGVPIPVFGDFEEVNLRFYVVRNDEGTIKRGVVFIQEAVPYAIVSWLANRLYKEHYEAMPMKHRFKNNSEEKELEYKWKYKNDWHQMSVKALSIKEAIEPGSKEEFIFEHYYGFTKISSEKTEEYKVEHPRWMVHPIKNYAINCDFGKLYGSSFAHLNHKDPDSVMLAEGSHVSVKWERKRW